jgi:acetyl esterase/lipase
MKYWIAAVFLIGMSNCFAQHQRMHPGVPADSTYNLADQVIKMTAKYPFIRAAVASVSDSVRVISNVVYERLPASQAVGAMRDLHLDLFLPRFKTSKKVPVVVLIHGGGWRSGNKDMEHYMAQVYALNGFAAVCVEYRLSIEAPYPAAVQDIKTALRWIRFSARRYHFDPSRVAIHGESAGGQLASLIGSLNASFPKYQTASYARFSDKVQAVVDVDGVQAFLHPESSEGADKPGKPSAATLWFGVPSSVDSSLFIEASALTHVGAQSAPFLYIDSSIPRFTAGQHDMMAALRSHGIYCEEHLLAGTPHSFWLFHPWVDETMQYAVGFLKQVLR